MVRSRWATSTTTGTVLAISAAREAEIVRHALLDGIVHCLMKPFSYDDLRERLEHYHCAYGSLAAADTKAAQGDVDRVFSANRTEHPLPKGLSAETLRLVEQTLPKLAPTCPPRRPLPTSVWRESAHAATSSISPTQERSGCGCATARSDDLNAATRTDAAPEERTPTQGVAGPRTVQEPCEDHVRRMRPQRRPRPLRPDHPRCQEAGVIAVRTPCGAR